jgi:hypothetical protein
MGIKGVRSARLQSTLKEMSAENRITHLKELYKVDEKVLLREMGGSRALNTAARTAALAEQKERWQQTIAFANTHSLGKNCDFLVTGTGDHR